MAVKIIISINGAQVAAVGGIAFSNGMNVQQAMEAAYNLHKNPVASFTLQYFGSTLGYEVIELDGIFNQVGVNSNAYVFWALSVNGHLSPTGIDSTELANGDEVEWNYEAFEPGVHGGTRHEKIRHLVTANSRKI